jgi:predicted O-methyltransferase YrrM
MEQRNVVGVFADSSSASAAVRFLEHAGFDPDVVSVIRGNVRQAREMSGSRSIPAAAIGAVIALILFAALTAASPEMRSNPVALVFGVAILLIAGIGIGTLAGRSRIFVADRAERLEDAVEEGETLVTVHVDEDQHERARRLLREAGAMNVREEETIERA